jgi:myo-inositol-1-phosphate synthase
LSGALISPSAYFKKSPPVQYTDEQARVMVEEFIQKYSKKRVKKTPSGAKKKVSTRKKKKR